MLQTVDINDDKRVSVVGDMMVWVVRVWVLMCCCAVSLVHAQAKLLPDQVKVKLEQELGLSVSSLADAPVNGLLQVGTDKGLFYVSENGQFLLQGRIFNIDAGMVNETERALGVMRLQGIEALEGSMLEFKADNEMHVIWVFTDTTCGYCRKLHNEMNQLNKMGITVKYLAFPRMGLNSEVHKQMESVWCAKSPQKAMTAAQNGQAVDKASCANKIAEHYEFGQRVGVTGTPNIVLPDGSMIPGYQEAKVIAQVLQGA